MKYALFLGCTIPARSRNYEMSARKVGEKLGIQLVDVEDYEARINRKLQNESFVKKAPADIVEKEKQKLSEALSRKAKIKDNISMLNSLS